MHVGGALGAEYTIARFLGVGSVGPVYEVRDRSGRRLVAKTLRIEAAGDDSFDALRMEARRISVLDPSRVLPIVDVGIDESAGVQFAVLPFLSGSTLEQVVEKLGPLHPMAAVRLVLQVCDGLVDAHTKGILHGDLKPSNVLLEHLDGGEVAVRIADFGLANWGRWRRSLARTGSIPPAALATPYFKAPEQLFDEGDVDERADVWGIGMTLYFALCAAPLRLGDDDGFGKLHGIEELQEAAPWVPPELAEIVHGALIRDPDKRCPSIDAWMAALAPFAGSGKALTVSTLSPVPPQVARVIAKRSKPPSVWDPARGFEAVSLPPLDLDPLLGQVVGGYRVEKLIGRGGMGSVYEASDGKGRCVALKVLNDSLLSKPGSLQRMVREAKSLAKIASHHVVRVLDAGVDPVGNRPYLVMELLKGMDLERYLLRCGALDPGPVVRLFIGVCEGLEAAHAAGVIHRDIKPSNIFLHEDPDGQAIPKLFDFGIAKHVDSSVDASALTRTGAIIGSPRYISPETAQGAKRIDRRCDIWSLGVTLYESLAGVNPWQEYNNVGELLIAICTKPVPPLREFAPWIDPGLAKVVERCISRNADERYQSAAELSADLEPHMARESVFLGLLGPVSTGRIASSTTSASHAPTRPVARLRSKLLTIAVVAVLACLAAVLSSWRLKSSASVPPASSAVETPMLATGSVAASSVAASAKPRDVKLRIEARPKKAVLFVDGARMPTNPHERLWLADGAPHVIRAEAPGFQAEERRVHATDNETIVLNLAPERTAPRAEASATRHRSPKSTPTDCSPPYYLDARGVKKFKPGCI